VERQLTVGHVPDSCDLVGDDVQQTAKKSANMISAMGRSPSSTPPIAAPEDRLFRDRGIANAVTAELSNIDRSLEHTASCADVSS